MTDVSCASFWPSSALPPSLGESGAGRRRAGVCQPASACSGTAATRTRRRAGKARTGSRLRCAPACRVRARPPVKSAELQDRWRGARQRRTDARPLSRAPHRIRLRPHASRPGPCTGSSSDDVASPRSFSHAGTPVVNTGLPRPGLRPRGTPQDTLSCQRCACLWEPRVAVTGLAWAKL